MKNIEKIKSINSANKVVFRKQQRYFEKIENLEQNFDYNGAIEAITEFLGTNSNKFTDKDFYETNLSEISPKITLKLIILKEHWIIFPMLLQFAKTYKIRQGLLI